MYRAPADTLREGALNLPHIQGGVERDTQIHHNVGAENLEAAR